MAKHVIHWLLKNILKEEVLVITERWTVRCCLFLFIFAALRRVFCRSRNPSCDRHYVPHYYPSKQEEDLYYSQFLAEPHFENSFGQSPKNHPVSSRIQHPHSM